MSHLRRLGQLFYSAHNLKQAVGILFVTVLFSNLLGLLRNVIIANRVGLTYGTVGPLDSYYAAFTLPDLLYTILIVGALSSAILPLLVKVDAEKDEARFWRLYNSLISTGLVVVAIGLVVLFLVMPYVVPILFAGFDAEKLEMTLRLGQVLLISPLFFTLSQISTSALQAKRHFFAPALAPLLYNLAIISSALLIPRYGLPVLVFGVILGAASHFLIQLPALIRLGWRFEFLPSFRDPQLRHIMSLMIPRTIALTSTQLLIIGFYQIASHLNPGSIAIYRLTDDLQTAPVLLLANTLAMAILPDFARKFASNEHREFEQLTTKALRLLLFIFLPVTVFLLLYAQPIINLYVALGRAISVQETQAAVATFRFFTLSLFFQGAVLLLARAYFARSNTRAPALFSIVSIGVAYIFAQIFVGGGTLGVAGMAAAFSIGSFLNALLLWLGLRLPWRDLILDEDGRFNFGWLLLGTLATTTVFIVIRRLAPVIALQLGTGPAMTYLVEILVGLTAGLIFYFAWARAFRLEQWQLIKKTKASTEK